MDLTAPASGAAATWVPAGSCTLPTGAQPLRVAEFDDLFASSLRSVEHSGAAATRARLVLSGDTGLATRARQLADAETACCSFFTFTLTPLAAGVPGETVVALDIEVPPSRSDVLAALVQRADRLRQAAS
jgi:hypothetical protein